MDVRSIDVTFGEGEGEVITKHHEWGLLWYNSHSMSYLVVHLSVVFTL